MIGFFDLNALSEGWFAPELQPAGWFDADLLADAGGGAGEIVADAALTQAAQTAAATAGIAIVAAAAPAQAGQALAAAGQIALAAQAAPQQAPHAVAALGAVDVLASAMLGQAAQVLAATLGADTVIAPAGAGAPLRRLEIDRPAVAQLGGRALQTSAARLAPNASQRPFGASGPRTRQLH